jgi:threonine/homoserine/homoserine lactone efflux protein
VNATILFFIGVLIAFVGVIPPGMLNMSAAKISLKEGHQRGFIFSVGVCLVVCVQTYLAVVFAEYLNHHPNVVFILKRSAFVVFVLIATYFLWHANKRSNRVVKPEIKSGQSRFFQGIFMSALNIFPIPFQAYVATTLASYGWLEFEPLVVWSYVSGSAMGTFICLYVYILFFDRIKHTKITTPKYMNYCIGIITATVALMTLIGILKNL